MTVAALLKAEMVLAIELATRHRSVRLAALLALVGLTVVRSGDGVHPMLLLVAGVLATTAAARALAPGPAVHMARRAGAAPLLVAAGRLAGVGLLLAAALVLAAAIAGGGHAPDLLGWSAAALLGGLALAAGVLALTPLLGASGSAGLGILAALFGQLPPTALAALLDRWPLARDAAVLLWNVAPLGWRVERWMRAGRGEDAVLLVVWMAIGIAAAAWTLLPPRGNDGTVQ